MKLLDKIMIGILITFIIVALYNVISFFIVDEQILLKRDWNINMPKPQGEKVIYSSFGISDGVELQIWQYSNKESKTIIEQRQLKKIEKENIDMLKNRLNEHYKLLKEDEQKLFDMYIEVTTLLTEENYYIISNSKVDERSWVLLIFNNSKNEIYYFTTTW